jgi:hypothetical protein
VWLLPRWKKLLFPLIILGVLQLLFLTFLYWKEHFFIIAQLIEYSLQWSTPLFLLYWIIKGETASRMFFWLKLAIALTFVGHGFYALGWHPRPAHFLTMMMWLPGVTEARAADLLWIAGVLDLVVAVLIFLPRVRLPALAYAAAWGLITALARVLTHLTPAEDAYGLIPWAFETLVRLPHGLLPLLLLALLCRRGETTRTEGTVSSGRV